MRTSLFTSVLFLTTLQTQAETQILVFTVQPGSEVTYLYSSSTGGSDSDVSLLSGTVQADLTFDDATLTPQGLTFTGGQTALSNLSLSFTTNIFYNAAGRSYSTNLGFSTNGLEQSYATRVSSGQVASGSGLLTNSEHETIGNRGTATSQVSIPSLGINETETTNFVSNPETDLFSGQNSIQLALTSATLFSRNLTASLSGSVEETLSEAIEDTNATLSISQNGSFTAVATFSLVTPYGQWALDNQLVEPAPDATNAAKLPYGLLFAFGLDADATSLPIEMIQTSSGPKAQLQLPAAGLAASVTALYSANLSDSFQPLANQFLDDGVNALQEGEIGIRTVSLPSGPRGFLRFAANL